MIDLEKLKAVFPKEYIQWRANSVTKDGKKAMALAYVDARAVMDRLDEVCGPAGWQCKYSHANSKTVCDIGIQIFEDDVNKHHKDFWVWKADGAGDSDIEAEKGALSDAFKRAAVRWGIGRYLYDFGSPWVPCESWQDNNGKWRFSKFTADPWNFLVNEKPPVFNNAALRKNFCEVVIKCLKEARTEEEVSQIWRLDQEKIDALRMSGNEHDALAYGELEKQYKMAASRTVKKGIVQKDIVTASFGQEFASLTEWDL